MIALMIGNNEVKDSRGVRLLSEISLYVVYRVDTRCPRTPFADYRTFKWFSIKIFYKFNEKLIYFYCLSVNYNNRSSAVDNGSQNSIHCRWQATKLY
jgi:hypothetical protein